MMSYSSKNNREKKEKRNEFRYQWIIWKDKDVQDNEFRDLD